MITIQSEREALISGAYHMLAVARTARLNGQPTLARAGMQNARNYRQMLAGITRP